MRARLLFILFLLAGGAPYLLSARAAANKKSTKSSRVKVLTVRQVRQFVDQMAEIFSESDNPEFKQSIVQGTLIQDILKRNKKMPPYFAKTVEQKEIIGYLRLRNYPLSIGKRKQVNRLAHALKKLESPLFFSRFDNKKTEEKTELLKKIDHFLLKELTEFELPDNVEKAVISFVGRLKAHISHKSFWQRYNTLIIAGVGVALLAGGAIYYIAKKRREAAERAEEEKYHDLFYRGFAASSWGYIGGIHLEPYHMPLFRNTIQQIPGNNFDQRSERFVRLASIYTQLHRPNFNEIFRDGTDAADREFNFFNQFIERIKQIPGTRFDQKVELVRRVCEIQGGRISTERDGDPVSKVNEALEWLAEVSGKESAVEQLQYIKTVEAAARNSADVQFEELFNVISLLKKSPGQSVSEKMRGLQGLREVKRFLEDNRYFLRRRKMLDVAQEIERIPGDTYEQKGAALRAYSPVYRELFNQAAITYSYSSDKVFFEFVEAVDSLPGDSFDQRIESVRTISKAYDRVCGDRYGGMFNRSKRTFFEWVELIKNIGDGSLREKEAQAKKLRAEYISLFPGDGAPSMGNLSRFYKLFDFVSGEDFGEQLENIKHAVAVHKYLKRNRSYYLALLHEIEGFIQQSAVRDWHTAARFIEALDQQSNDDKEREAIPKPLSDTLKLLEDAAEQEADAQRELEKAEKKYKKQSGASQEHDPEKYKEEMEERYQKLCALEIRLKKQKEIGKRAYSSDDADLQRDQAREAFEKAQAKADLWREREEKHATSGEDTLIESEIDRSNQLVEAKRGEIAALDQRVENVCARVREYIYNRWVSVYTEEEVRKALSDIQSLRERRDLILSANYTIEQKISLVKGLNLASNRRSFTSRLLHIDFTLYNDLVRLFQELNNCEESLYSLMRDVGVWEKMQMLSDHEKKEKIELLFTCDANNARAALEKAEKELRRAEEEADFYALSESERTRLINERASKCALVAKAKQKLEKLRERGFDQINEEEVNSARDKLIRVRKDNDQKRLDFIERVRASGDKEALKYAQMEHKQLKELRDNLVAQAAPLDLTEEILFTGTRICEEMAKEQEEALSLNDLRLVARMLKRHAGKPESEIREYVYRARQRYALVKMRRLADRSGNVTLSPDEQDKVKKETLAPLIMKPNTPDDIISHIASFL